jgi:putative nucleotidyltransferase with HDIG domain
MNRQSSTERLIQLANLVHIHLKDSAAKFPHPSHDPEYRMQHSLRVAFYGKNIASEEGANIEQVIAACLLHDIAHFESEGDYPNHGRLGAQLSRPILKGLGYSEPEIDNICYSIAAHVDGMAGYSHEDTLEARVVSDADNIDRFGAFRVIQWCSEGIADYDTLIVKLRKRILKLKEYQLNLPLETKTGRRLFSAQLALQIDFYNKIIRESEITQLPSISFEAF